MAKRYWLLSAVVLTFLTCTVWSQASGDNVKLDKERPAVEIAFACVGKRDPRREGESTQGTWLKLRNNLKWQLKVPGSYIEPSYAWTKGQSEAVLFYEIEDNRIRFVRSRLRDVSDPKDDRIPPPPIGYRMTDLVKYVYLAPGESLVFSIPSEHLNSNLALSVSFNFSWEDVMDNSTHRVYFNGSELPEALTPCRTR